MLTEVVGGGRTGGDQAGRRAAKAVGLASGGSMTEEGPRPEFAELQGSVEMPKAGQALKPRPDVRSSDGVAWLVSIGSRGLEAQPKAAAGYRPEYRFPIIRGHSMTPSEVADWMAEDGVRILNVAGNRESVSPGIGERAERFLLAVFRRLSR